MTECQNNAIALPASPSSATARHQIIFDGDPGYDDAIALILAAAFAEVSLVTTVMGNACVNCTSRNAALTCRMLNLNIPVAKGAPGPLSTDPPLFEQEDAAVWIDLSQRVDYAPPAEDAIALISEKAHPGTWIVATGPLTNIALALEHDPALANRLGGISMMAGGIGIGNVTNAAEFNVWADPEAASAVLGSSLQIRVCPLNVTETVLADRRLIDSLRGIATPLADFAVAVITDYIQIYPGPTAARQVAPLHDPCAVLALTHPHLFRFTSSHVTVELTDRATRGMTIARTRGPGNIVIATEVDSDGVRLAIYDAIAKLGTGSSP